MPSPGRRLSPTHRPLYTWNVSSQLMCTFLRKVMPYLIVKKDEAELALELQDSIDRYKFKLGNRYWLHPERDAILARRAEIATEMSALKHRIFPLTD